MSNLAEADAPPTPFTPNGADTVERHVNFADNEGESARESENSKTGDDEDDGPKSPTPNENRFLRGFKGMQDDVSARKPYYMDDFARPKSLITVGNAILFAFVVQLIPALIFAELLAAQTEDRIAVAETLLSTGIIGIIYALLSGQPLVLLGVTGPVAMLLGTTGGLANTFGADFWPFFWWMCIWTALLHFVTALSGLVNLVFYITPFTSEIFEFFIALSFMYESLRDVLQPLQLASDDLSTGARTTAYATLVIAILTFFICIKLHFAETWVFFTPGLRTFLTSYNMALAVIVVTALSYLPGVDQSYAGTGGLPRVHVKAPWDWQPTDNRSWLIHPIEGISAGGIFGALVPAIMLFLLFYVDHNISSMLTQATKYNLTKPPAYHWDFFVLGLTIIPCGILGLPPGSGLIPQAPLHTRALSTRRIEVVHGITTEVVTYVEEQRWSGLGQSALMFVALALFVVLALIPQGALFGVFFYLGFTAMYGNEIWTHITIDAIPPSSRPSIPVVKEVKWSRVRLYTAVQVTCALLIFAVAQFAPFAFIFPLLVMLLVPIRTFAIARMFEESELRYLDPIAETDEEWHKERVAMHDAVVKAQVDAVDLFPGRSSFRANSIGSVVPIEGGVAGVALRHNSDSLSLSESLQSWNADVLRDSAVLRRRTATDQPETTLL